MVAQKFAFADLFAGVGGFHAVLAGLGGRAVVAAEIDDRARAIYERNWSARLERDVVDLARRAHDVPDHHVLAAGFPCQPFSKSGAQKGIREVRGRLFNEMLKIIAAKRPAMLVLENVRNLVGPRQRPTFDSMVDALRDLGYFVPRDPSIVSPHQLPKSLGGTPQSRERVYILGTYVGRQKAWRLRKVEPLKLQDLIGALDAPEWDFESDIALPDGPGTEDYVLPVDGSERSALEVWQHFLDATLDRPLPGFPLWSQFWRDGAKVNSRAPQWKQAFERKNIEFFHAHRDVLEPWLDRFGVTLRNFPPSRQKFEWQAQDEKRDLSRCLIQFRPSGIRVKKLTHAPALVAIGQTPILGPRMRRLTPREAARLQGFPDWFDFGEQSPATTYKQMGNAIHLGVAYLLIRNHILKYADELTQAGADVLVRAAEAAPPAFDSTRLRQSGS